MSGVSGLEEIEERLRLAGVDLTLGKNGELSSGEIFWRDHQPWLKQRGYTLRKRYQPDWIPSWKSNPEKTWSNCEDGVSASYCTVLDAMREDGSLVVLKQSSATSQSDEGRIGTMLSSEPLASHPGNHCAPIFEVLQVPDDPRYVILVMPYLHGVEQPPFETIGEAVEFFRQVFDALKFMHENQVAHRDIKYNNIMADTLHLYDSPPHFDYSFKNRQFSGSPRVIFSRTQKPVKYYLIDYGLSKVYKPEDAPYLEISGWGGDKSVPEFQTGEQILCDPFPVDVYCMGNTVRRYFLEAYLHRPAKKGFEFIHDLVRDMVKDDPKQRPTMAEVVSRFEGITKKLSNRKLRSRVVDVGEPTIPGILRSTIHWVKQAGFIIRRIPPIPKPQ